MKNRIVIACTVLFLASAYQTFAQDPDLNPTQILRSARATYDQGRLHEIPQMLAACLDPKNEGTPRGFSETERVEALKILVQTYIYLEEPGEADKAMLTLLHTDHFFIPNKTVDPIEFQSLWAKFRYNPVWRVGIKFGPLTNQVSVMKNYYVWEQSAGKGKFSSKVGIQVGGVFEKDLGKKIVAAPEVLYSSYTFDYTNDSPLFVQDPNAAEGLKVTNSTQQSRLNLNLLFQYKPWIKADPAENLVNKFIPYFAVGPSINYLMSSSSSPTANVTELVTESGQDSKVYYMPVNFSVIASVGAKYRIGGIYVTADVRYQYGITNVVDPAHRYDSYGNTIGYSNTGTVENDFKLSQASVNLGIIIPKFSPKKLIK